MPLRSLKAPFIATLTQRIVWLSACKWLALLSPPLLLLMAARRDRQFPLSMFLALALGFAFFAALRAWEQSLRRQFVREASLPRHLGAKLRQQYPQLGAGDVDLVLRGLRQFFMAHLRSNRSFVAMPSKVADAAWHEFILHTRGYEQWCRVAFGRLLHHTPAEVLGTDPKRNQGLRRSWFWACKEESINPRAPSRLPLLFALDKKFAIEGGFNYVPDCKDIDRQSGSDAYCGSEFGEGGGFGDAGGCGGGDGGADGGCGGGCGGGD